MTLTPTLPKGANIAVPSTRLRAAISWEGGQSIDVCALLLTQLGKVRSDADFVFYNQPMHFSGSVSLGTVASPVATLDVSLPDLEEEITRVVLAGSVDEGTFDDLSHLRIALTDDTGRPLTEFRMNDRAGITCLVFGELYRRADQWKFRAIGQGWNTGLAGLATDYGISVEEDSPQPAEVVSTPQARADWYPDGSDFSILRWWNGAAWTEESTPAYSETSTKCGRCGGRKKKKLFSSDPPTCNPCEDTARFVLANWRIKVEEALRDQEPSGQRWEALWAELRYHRITESKGQDIFRALAFAHLERIVAFAFADGIIEPAEIAGFEDAARQLQLSGWAVDSMRARLQRGLVLTRLREGELPRLQSETLHLEIGEIVHLDTDATHVRQLASGPKHTRGRLVATNRKLRFVSESGGTELAWTKIMEVTFQRGSLVVSTTASRGGGTYHVEDAEYAAEVLSTTLKIAKRLVIAPGRRDSRAIPPAIKAEVWQRDGGVCVQCGASEYLEFDHIIPHSRGGATSVGNLQLLCRRCNLEKGARI